MTEGAGHASTSPGAMMVERSDVGDVARAEDVLGPLEAGCMRVLWGSGASSVATVLEALNRARPQPLAYTTVMTVLARLHEKGWTEREPRGRHFLYRPACDERTLIERSSKLAVDAVLVRFGETALRQFAARLSDLEPDTRAALERLAAEDR